jgi:glycosyltransferase involved in cell wall biosynthesis
LITFAIPTWNRAPQVEKTVRSIAEQLRGRGKIVVCDHGSTDGTPEVLGRLAKEYDCLSLASLERPEGADFQDNFRYCFRLPQTEWTWTFGDDDLLLPGALDLVVEVIKTGVDFVHVAEVLRSDNTKTIVRRPTLFELCSDLGWLDMTGYITCNVVKTERLRKAVNSPSWDSFSKNAFPHACALLEELHDAPAMFIDVPLVDCQSHEVTKETVKRWSDNNTATRYFYVDEAIADMVKRGILHKPIDNVFFRYHSYFMWDRLITCMISQYAHHPTDSHPELWKHVEGLASFLDAYPARVLRDRITEVRNAITLHYKAMTELTMKAHILDGLMDGHNTERFGFSYLGEPKERKVEVVGFT